METAEDPLTGSLRDLKIDDRDLPLAKNYYDYVFNLAQHKNPPWARQFWSSAIFFGEVCPKCSNPKFLDLDNIDKSFNTRDFPGELQFLEYGICPKCKRSKRKLIKFDRIKNYQECILVWGQRSGKSTTVASMSDYHTHRFLKFPRFSSLSKVMQASTPLTFTFVSLTYSKAYSVLWEPFRNFIESSVWMKQYFDLMDFYSKKYNTHTYSFNKEFIKFHHKKLHLYPSNPDKSTLRGDTRFGAALDEIGLFRLPSGDEDEDEKSERANADEAHKSLTNSLLTVQSVSAKFIQQGYFHSPSGLMMGCSSPFSERDKAIRLLKESKGKRGSKYIFGSQLATWDVNPDIERTTPMIAVAFERNAEKAMRDFGAIPPRVSNVYIGRNVIRTGVFGNGKNTHELEYDYTDNEISGSIRRVANPSPVSLLSLDAGEVNNSFSACVFSFDFKTGKTLTTTVIEIVPTRGLRINHNKVYKHVLSPLIRDCNCVVALADRWNSLDILQRMRADFGIYAKQISPKRKDFDAVLGYLQDRTLELPKTEFGNMNFLDESVENYRKFFWQKPVAHLAYQMTTVQDVASSRPPEKGPGFTDDIFRAFVLGAAKIHNEKIQNILQKARPKANSVGGVAVSLGRSSNLWRR